LGFRVDWTALGQSSLDRGPGHFSDHSLRRVPAEARPDGRRLCCRGGGAVSRLGCWGSGFRASASDQRHVLYNGHRLCNRSR
jgi:hypothetical protein